MLVHFLVVFTDDLANFRFLSSYLNWNVFVFLLLFFSLLFFVLCQPLIVLLVFKLFIPLLGHKRILSSLIFPVQLVELHEFLVSLDFLHFILFDALLFPPEGLSLLLVLHLN